MQVSSYSISSAKILFNTKYYMEKLHFQGAITNFHLPLEVAMSRLNMTPLPSAYIKFQPNLQ